MCGAAVMVGCGASTARIHRVDGATRAGVITGSDAETVWVREVDGREIARIPRAIIADIDHPGPVGMGVGSAIVVSGLVQTTVAGVALSEGGSGGLVPLGVVLVPMLVVGIGLVGAGAAVLGPSAWRYRASKTAAAPPGGEGSVQVGPGGVWVRF